MRTLRWIIPAAAIAVLSLWGCTEEGYEEGSDTTVIEDPDVTVEEDDGFKAEIDVDDDGNIEGDVKVEN